MTKPVDLKPRSPLTWLLLGLLLPFSLFYWIHKTNGQVNHLNRLRGSERRVMTPWWLLLTTIALGGLISGLLVSIWLSGNNQTSYDWPASTPVSVVDDGGVGLTYPVADSPPDTPIVQTAGVVETDPGLPGWLTLSIILVAGVIWPAWTILYIIYLLQYVEAVAALGATRQERDTMIIVAVLSLGVILPLYLFVVYKSQVIIDRALADPAVTGSGPAAKLAT